MTYFQYLFNLFKVLILFSFTSCAISSIPLDIVRPADIDVPSHIQNILIVNRSLPSKGNQVNNILDGFLSGENIGQDKKGSEMCLYGLKNALSDQPIQIVKFNIIEADGLLSGNFFRGTGTSEFTRPIKWKKINKLSENYDFDGLIVLETFDSGSSISNGGIIKKTKKIKGRKVEETFTKAILTINVQAGWRIYDVLNQKIIDEKIFNDFKEFSALGLTFQEAEMKLPNKNFAVAETGEFAGHQYASRISPSIVQVRRYYYTKANKRAKKENQSFKQASDLLLQNNVHGATAIWQQFTSHFDQKIASRACFNMALASELKNKYNLAVDWIEKSINYDNNPKSIEYLLKLKDRNMEIKILEEQLKN